MREANIRHGHGLLPAALTGWTKLNSTAAAEYERSLEAESSLQPEPPPASEEVGRLMMAVDDLRSELSCSGPKGLTRTRFTLRIFATSRRIR